MEGVLTLLRPASKHWKPVVLRTSATQVEGIGEFWDTVVRCRDTLAQSGALAEKRKRQALAWTWHLIDSGLRARFRARSASRRGAAGRARAVGDGTLTPTAAAALLLGDDQQAAAARPETP